MKLLRVNNGSNLTTFWTNNFGDLKIKPNSQIALQNISMALENTYIINAANDTFTVQAEQEHFPPPHALTGVRATVKIPHGEYKSFESLLSITEYQLNASMTGGFADTAQRGLQWLVNYDTTDSKKVAIRYAQTDAVLLGATQKL